MSTLPDSSVRPTIVIGADSRFATTFLSTKYRDRAINGEALMDKTSGELFIKRPSDGKIVSFYQNKKTINELALDLRILLMSNPLFVYPQKDNNAFFISTNYDLITINNERLYNLLTDDIVIPGEPNDINKLSFIVSGNSNGFFCRNTSRDADKAFIELLTNQYDTVLKNYTGTDEEYLTEYEKFQTNDKWENSNAVLTYDLIVNKGGTEYSYLDNKSYIILNDDTPIFFPSQIYTDLTTFDYVTVTIKSLTYDKIHFMVNHKDGFGDPFVTIYNKFIPHDQMIGITEFNISYFIDDLTRIELFGNEEVIALLDIPHLNAYTEKIRKAFVGDGGGEIQISATQPTFPSLWFKPNLTD